MAIDRVFVVYTEENEQSLILTINSLLRHNPGINVNIACDSELKFSERFLTFIEVIKYLGEVKYLISHTVTKKEGELFAAGLSCLCENGVDRLVYLHPGIVVNGNIKEMFTVNLKRKVYSAHKEFHMENHGEHFVKVYRNSDVFEYDGKKSVNDDFFNIGAIVFDLQTMDSFHRESTLLQDRYLTGNAGESLEDFLNYLLAPIKNVPMPNRYNHLPDYHLSQFMSHNSAINNSIDGKKSIILNFVGDYDPIKTNLMLDIRSMRLPMDIYLREFKEVEFFMDPEVSERVNSISDKYIKLVLPLREALEKFWYGDANCR